MFAKKLMKNPILMVGILMMVIFLFQLQKKGYFAKRYVPTSCKSVLVMLEKRAPATWEVKCEENNLAVKIIKDLSVKEMKNEKLYKTVLYRELANDLIFVAKNSLNESLERVFFVRIHLTSQKMNIDALTEGKFLSKLATINKPRFIAEHLHATVQTKETLK